MSFFRNREIYISLMESFLNKQINGSALQNKYIQQWRSDRDEEWEMIDNSDQRYDLILLEKRRRGELTQEEFKIQWRKLTGLSSADEEAIVREINGMFTCLNDYDPDQEHDTTLCFGDNQLEIEVTKALKRLRLLTG